MMPAPPERPACDSDVSVLLGHAVVTDVSELHIERAGATDQDSAAIERTNDARLFALAGDTVCVEPFVGLRSEGSSQWRRLQ